jgi:hypothetical protein
MVQKYAAILDVDPEKSPFIQNLHKFLEVDEGSNVVKVPESKSPRASESGKVEESSTKQGVSKVKDPVRAKRITSRPPLKSVSLPGKIWQGFWKFLHALGF